MGAVLLPDALASALEPSHSMQDAPVGDVPLHLVPTGLSVSTDGTFMLPHAASVLLNVGTHQRLEEEWVRALERPDVAVLCFEPDRTTFLHLRMWSRTVLLDRLGHDALARLFLFPCALGPVAGSRSRMAKLHRSSFADGQCNSLLPPNPDHKSSWGAAGCGAGTSPPEVVLVVTLAEVLRRLGSLSVELLKIDAQGLDLEVIRSGGHYFAEKVEHVQIEVQDVAAGSEKLLYAGMHTQQVAATALDQLGFTLRNCSVGTPELRERDCLFSNRRLGGSTRAPSLAAR